MKMALEGVCQRADRRCAYVRDIALDSSALTFSQMGHDGGLDGKYGGVVRRSRKVDAALMERIKIATNIKTEINFIMQALPNSSANRSEDSLGLRTRRSLDMEISSCDKVLRPEYPMALLIKDHTILVISLLFRQTSEVCCPSRPVHVN